MNILQHCQVSFRLNGTTHQGSLAIEQMEGEQDQHYRAVIESTPLHGTYGGAASTVEMALDFLNLAMQAEGADEIAFQCLPTGS